MHTPDLQPIHPAQRIPVLDSLRGFALLGILLMNIPYFGMPAGAVFNLNLRDEYSGPNYYTWWIVNFLFEGSMRGTFSMLFGAGMVLLTARLAAKTPADTADIYYRRLLWLLLFGLVDAFIILWPGDILYSYAICGLFLFPFRRMAPRPLLAVAGVLLVLFTLKTTYQDNEPLRLKQAAEAIQKIDTLKTTLTDDQKESVQAWAGFQEKQTLAAKKKNMEKDARKVKGDLATVFGHFAEVNARLQSVNFYQENFLDCLIFMLVGIAFYKLDILTGRRTARFYALMAAAGYAIAFPMVYWRLNLVVTEHFDLVRILQQTPFDSYELRRLALTVGHLGLLLCGYKLGYFRFLFKAWAKVGQMAFSNYLAQNIICGLIFYGFAFNHYNELPRYQLYGVVACVWAFNVAFSYAWLRYFRMGPLEWVWRSLTYWQVQPLRVRTAVPQSALAADQPA